jgi:hypothetical protein
MITDRPLPGTPAPAVIRAAAVLRAIAAADGNSRRASWRRRLTPHASVINVSPPWRRGWSLGKLADWSSGRRSGLAAPPEAMTVQRFPVRADRRRSLRRPFSSARRADVLTWRHDGHQPIT